MRVHIRLDIRKELSDGDLANVILNILEHITQEREYWIDNGILDSFDQLEPHVLPIPLKEKLHKEINRNLREGYIFCQEEGK